MFQILRVITVATFGRGIALRGIEKVSGEATTTKQFPLYLLGSKLFSFRVGSLLEEA